MQTIKKYTLQILLWLLTLVCLQPNALQSQTKPVKELVKGASILYDDFADYENALAYYTEAYEQGDDPLLIIEIAHCYRMLRDYTKAEEWYKLVDKKRMIAAFPEAKYWLSTMLIAQGKYIEAKLYLDEFIESYRGDRSILLAADLAYNNCNYAIRSINNPVKVKIENAGIIINTWYSENNVMKIGDNSIYYSSDTKTINLGEVKLPKLKYSDLDKIDTIHQSKIYEGVLNDKEWLTKPSSYFPIINGYELVGTPCLFKGKSVLYLSLRKYGKSETHIYRSEKYAGTWSKLKKLTGAVNEKKSRCIHPFAFRFGDDEVLFYASDKEGGQGGYDIYYAVFDGKGKYKKGQSLGSTYNTEFNEVSPFFDVYNQALYFSSEGYEGIGQLDVYQLKGNISDGWDEVDNIGFPVNSSADDYFYRYDSKMDLGYFSSNRNGGLNINSRYDDIYRLKYKFVEEVINFKTTMRFFDSKSESVVSDLVMKIYDKTELEVPIYKFKTDLDEFKVSFPLKSNLDYVIKVEKSCYESLNLNVSVRKLVVASTGQKMTYFFSNDEDSDVINALQANVFMDRDPSYRFKLGADIDIKGVDFDQPIEELPDVSLASLAEKAKNEKKSEALKAEQSGSEIEAIENEIDKTIEKVSAEKAYTKMIEDFPYKKLDNIYFRVQVGAYEKAKKEYFNFLNRFGTVGEERNGTLYKYVIGSFETIDDAREFLEQMKVQGIKDAFVCAYYNNMRVSMKEIYKIFYLHP